MSVVRIELPPKLIPVFDGKADVRGAFGGRGSGKSHSFAKMSAVQALRFAEVGREGVILCGRQFANSLEESSFAEVEAAIKSEFWLLSHFEIGTKYIKTRDGRVRYRFVGLERHLSSIKSKSGILLAWIDEAEDVKELAWKVLLPTLRADSVELWVTWNPAKMGSATDKRFRAANDPLYKIVPLNWRDNPRFPEVLERLRLRDMRDDPDNYDWIWEGAYRTATDGAVFAREIAKADAAGRVTNVPHDPSKPVHTLWDLGWADSLAVWCVQRVGLEWRCLEYKEFTQTTVADAVKWLQGRPYVWAEDWLPHDADAETLAGDGKSIAAKIRDLGRKVKVIARVSRKAGAIDALRDLFPSLWFDREGCADGLSCLRNYSYKVDPETKEWSREPEHNWASHGADALMQLGQGVQDQSRRPKYNPDALKGGGSHSFQAA